MMRNTVNLRGSHDTYTICFLVCRCVNQCVCVCIRAHRSISSPVLVVCVYVCVIEGSAIQ